MKLRICSTAVIGIAAAAVSAGPANAGLLANAAPSCDAQPISSPFTPWLDYANYTPLSGGNFESSGAGWTMSGGARIAAGNESYKVARRERREVDGRSPAAGRSRAPRSASASSIRRCASSPSATAAACSACRR